jgi:Outer membrane protein beta-barrel domain
MQSSTKRKSVITLLFFLLAAGAISTRAQVVPSATAKGLSIAAGGEISGFQPDYTGFGVPAQAGFDGLLAGIGAYVDVKFTPWVQAEGEARWMRFNQPAGGIYEDNYLIGPRLPLYRLNFWRATPYVKVLVGSGKLNFEHGNGYGRYTDIAYGGGLDIKMTDRLTLRAPDFEFQQWPGWTEGFGNSTTLFPYGVSVGVSYRFLGLK